MEDKAINLILASLMLLTVILNCLTFTAVNMAEQENHKYFERRCDSIQTQIDYMVE